MYKLKRKIISFIISLIMFINVPLCGFSTSYADGIADYNPALIPIFALVSTIMIGSGIVARNAEDSLNQLTSNVINNIKNTEVARSEADANYNSAYRVINGGKMEKPNNNNKNGKWFGLGVASALGSAVAFEKGAVEDIMNTVDELNGYRAMTGSVGIISADEFKTKGTASSIALDLANLSPLALQQFNDFLSSDFFANNNLDKNNCLYFVNTSIRDLANYNNDFYPRLSIVVVEKSDELKYLDVAGNVFGYYTFSGTYDTKSYYYVSNIQPSLRFLNNDKELINLNTAKIFLRSYHANSEFQYTVSQNPTLRNNLEINGFNSAGSALTETGRKEFAFSGFKWQSENPWGFTNNVYNNTQNFNVNFPDWLQDSFSLLGQNVEGIRLGIDNLNEYWQNTQPNVQVGETPENVIAQLLNNYLNPENAPEPEPDNNPDDNPEPKPYAPEVFLPFSEPELDDAVGKLWEWTSGKITLPDGFWDKLPFSIPYDVYLLTSSMFPVSGSSKRRMLRASVNSPMNPNGITISSNFEAYGENTRQYNMNDNKWVQNAPIINLDLHFKYHDSNGSEKTLDYVKTVDLAPYAYFAMIIYIAIYISWFGLILGFILNMFK